MLSEIKLLSSDKLTDFFITTESGRSKDISSIEIKPIMDNTKMIMKVHLIDNKEFLTY